MVSNNLKTLPSPNAVRGKLTHKLGMREVTCECRIPYTAALRQAYVDQSALQVQIAHGTTPGRMTLFSLPQTHLASISGPVDQEEYAYCDATFRALRYVGDTEPAGGQGADNRLFSVAF
ncbi:MAG: hypothetical protein M5U09_13545 [Gammaproteobacteria bacterium]|nr:hypothetical protein [Gammaproteobacteria bacterium]